jgi:hypothetical protein
MPTTRAVSIATIGVPTSKALDVLEVFELLPDWGGSTAKGIGKSEHEHT